MSGKSQELIAKLLAAEDQAEKLVKAAREMRSSKMKDVKTAADEELAPFKAKEESKYNQDLAALKATNDISADLAKSTKSELDMVKNEFESNKKKVTDFVIGKVLDVDISVAPCLKAAMAG